MVDFSTSPTHSESPTDFYLQKNAYGMFGIFKLGLTAWAWTRFGSSNYSNTKFLGIRTFQNADLQPEASFWPEPKTQNARSFKKFGKGNVD